MSKRYLKYGFMALLATMSLCGCKKDKDPSPPMSFTSGMAIYYGQYYQDKGVDAYVWEMEFYSGSVAPNDGGYSGTGQILTFTDVFSPAPTEANPLPFGTYMLNDSHEEYTVIPGMQKDGYDLGAYLTTLVDGQMSALEYFTMGSLTIEAAQDDSVSISFDFQRTSGTIYHNSFHSVLPLYTAIYNAE